MILVCGFMFLGAVVAGMSWVPLSKKALDAVNVFGVGLLLGTGLGVIIPEGVRELFHAGSHHAEHLVGISLVLGFLTMLVMDHLACCGGASGLHGHSHDVVSSTPSDIPKSPVLVKTANRPATPQHDHVSDKHHHDDDDDDLEVQRSNVKRRRATVTLGLLIHNMADGLAMGASKASRAEWTPAQMLVFSAIMIHHIPAAFGFAAFLRSSGMDEFQVRERVLVFASIGPITALVSFLILHYGLVGSYSIPKEAVGVCLLYSGGTFLYVAAVHALDEARKGSLLSPRQVGILCSGGFLPLLMSFGHHH